MKRSFQKKIFFYLSIMLTGFVCLILVAFSYYVYHTMEKEAEQSLNQLTMRTSTELTTLLDNLDQLSLYISTNPEVMKAFHNAKTQSVPDAVLIKQLIQILTSITIPNNASRYRINLYNDKGNFISTGIPYSKDRVKALFASDRYAQWYADLPDNHGSRSITPLSQDIWSDSGVDYVSLYREIFDPTFISTSNGIIEIQCPYKVIHNILEFDSDAYQSYLFDENGALFYTSSADVSVDAQTLYASYASHAMGDNSVRYGRALISGVVLGNGWTMIITQMQAHIFQVLLPIVMAVTLVGIAVLCTCLAITYAVTRRTTEPLRKLTHSIKEVTLSNLALHVDFAEDSDEFASLNTAFQKMFHRLKRSMDENVTRKTYEMKANMIALQSQMDPHFLYNMLAIIKAMSKENNARQISLTCDYLSNMLRYISSYDEEWAPLSREILHVENYFKLMKLRFEDQFSYNIRVDPRLEVQPLRIPKLSLQPLIENCFQHGFKKVLPPWTIDIRCWQSDGRWYLQVADNGGGMTEDTVTQLRQKVEDFLQEPSMSIASLKIGGMGLVNTIARLKLAYKNSLIYQIDSLPQGGTSITIGGAEDHEYPIGGG